MPLEDFGDAEAWRTKQTALTMIDPASITWQSKVLEYLGSHDGLA
jgi:hypothetical protein